MAQGVAAPIEFTVIPHPPMSARATRSLPLSPPLPTHTAPRPLGNHCSPGLAQDTAAGIEAQLLQMQAPLLAVSVLVRQQPYVPRALKLFEPYAQELLAGIEVRPACWCPEQI